MFEPRVIAHMNMYLCYICAHIVYTTCVTPCVCLLGISYSMDEPERSATMSRIETKKSKEKKSYLSTLPASSEEILEGTVGSRLI